MARSIIFSILVLAGFLCTGFLLKDYLGEAEDFTCIDGSPLRLADDRWHCDSANPAMPILVNEARLMSMPILG